MRKRDDKDDEDDQKESWESHVCLCVEEKITGVMNECLKKSEQREDFSLS